MAGAKNRQTLNSRSRTGQAGTLETVKAPAVSLSLLHTTLPHSSPTYSLTSLLQVTTNE
jgi:hypothetical protein